MILIIDFGSQTCHLISRRIKDMGVEAEIILPHQALEAVKNRKPRGLILSGGPASVYSENALLIDKKIFYLEIPVLGICYGLQVMAQLLGGKVAPGKKKEYGPTVLSLKSESSLFKNLPPRFKVWMSHFDMLTAPPENSTISASTPELKIAAIADKKNKFYGVQFHPEVHHTEFGTEILENFVLGICSEKAVTQKIKIADLIRGVKEIVKENQAVCALSGGIDSTVTSELAYRALGNKLTCLYIDTGLMRQGETGEIIKTIKKHFAFRLKVISAEDIFLRNLKGVTDPESKRKIIGETFIRVFEKEAKSLNSKFLLQGTIYPDVIESKGTLYADKIKTHHNVGGIPAKHGFTIVEPLRMLYKDEVRALAKEMKIPDSLINRHVFPGPGLAVRIIGEVTRAKLEILKKADRIVIEEIKNARLYNKIWMAFAVFTGIKTTGVTGDERKYGQTIAIRAIESKDTMTADWVRLPDEVLARISERIVTEVFEVVRVVYDITTKPPATMEWE